MIRSFDFEIIKKRVGYACRKYGVPSEYTDDFVQEVCKKYLEKPDGHQTIDQAVIDLARRTFGNEKRYCNTYKFRKNLDEFDPGGKEILGACVQEPQQDLLLDIQYADCLEHPLYRAIYILKALWGFTEAEIGFLYGVTESRISQHFIEIKKILLEQDIEEPALEKVEMGQIELGIFYL